jgi:hypothetical protein
MGEIVLTLNVEVLFTTNLFASGRDKKRGEVDAR